MLQIFFNDPTFSKYKTDQFALWTESYGGHYGPEFAKYSQDQNTAGKGQKINLVALGVNNGWFDAEIQEPAYVQFSYNNTYKPLISKSQYNSYMNTFKSSCLPQIQQCEKSGSNSDCQKANSACGNSIENPLTESADFDVYDIRAPSNDPEPPQNYVNAFRASAS